MVIGRIPGTIGEVSVIALLIGAIYLVVRKVISPVYPADLYWNRMLYLHSCLADST